MIARGGLFREHFVEGLLHLRGLEPSRAHVAFVENLPVLVDNIQPIGPCAIGQAHGVVHVVDKHRDGYLQPLLARLGDSGALVVRRGLLEHDPLPLIGPHLPAVARVGFADIDNEELDPVAEPLLDGFKSANLAPERRSRIATEDENDGTLASEARQLDLALAVKFSEGEVRGRVAHFQSHVTPEVPPATLLAPREEAHHHHGEHRDDCSQSPSRIHGITYARESVASQST